MRTISKEFKIYKFDELSEKGQITAIENYIQWWLGTIDYETLSKNSNLYKAIKKAEDLQTPWFETQYIWDFCQKRILKDLRKDEYYESGILYLE